jgi:hypothetical protein
MWIAGFLAFGLACRRASNFDGRWTAFEIFLKFRYGCAVELAGQD